MQLFLLTYFNLLYMFRPMFSPIIRDISQLSTDVATGWCCVSCSYSDMLLMTGENIAQNM